MIRYIKVGEMRYILHAFVTDRALVEDPNTGVVSVVPAAGCVFDPPTEQFIQEQQLAQARAQAAMGGRGRIING